MTGSATEIRGCNERSRYSPMPPLLLRAQLILQPLGDRFCSLAFQSFFLPGGGLQSELLGEAIDFPRQPPILGFPGPVVCLDLRLELVKRLICRCRILEEGPIITKKEVIEKLICDVKILMLDVLLSASKHLLEGDVVTYIGGQVLLEECLAVFSQSVGDGSASSRLNERIDTVV